MWPKVNAAMSQVTRRKMSRIVAGALGVAGMLAGVTWIVGGSASAMSLSPEAHAIVEQQLKSACGSTGGSLSGGMAGQKAFYEGDLTGNGEMDFILSHSGVRCANDQINLRCGMEGCSLLIFARQGADLELATELDALDFEVEAGNPVPIINYLKKGGEIGTLRWIGTGFH